jgi:hypothetical protein
MRKRIEMLRKMPVILQLFIAMIVIIIIGSSLDMLDASFGTRMAQSAGIWLAGAAAILFIAYVVLAFKLHKKQ